MNHLSEKLPSHPSIKKIKDCFSVSHIFNFTFVTFDEIREEIFNLDSSKPTMHGDIPTNVLKGSIEVHLNLITEIIKK